MCMEQKAKMDEMIPDEYFDQNGDIRFDHVNDVRMNLTTVFCLLHWTLEFLHLKYVASFASLYEHGFCRPWLLLSEGQVSIDHLRDIPHVCAISNKLSNISNKLFFGIAKRGSCQIKKWDMKVLIELWS